MTEPSKEAREAAATVLRETGSESLACEVIRTGGADYNPFVKAFAAFEATIRAHCEANQTAAVREAVERACRIIQNRMDARFEEHGTREWDTNACYYSGAAGEIYEALDEEGEELIAAIRQLKEPTQ